MDPSERAFSETFVVGGHSYAGLLDPERAKVQIPCAARPEVQIGDLITRQTGTSSVQLRVVGIKFAEDEGSRIGAEQPHLLTLDVEDVTAVVFRSRKPRPQ